MLMDIQCEQISSIFVKLTFDDNSIKRRLISINDLVDVSYNGNGVRKHILGRVAAISTIGTDPLGWYIVVDGSDDFSSQKARFSPRNILDIEVIRKAGQDSNVHSPKGDDNIGFIRVTPDGQIQISKDGYEWTFPKINANDIIGLKQNDSDNKTINEDKEKDNGESIKDSSSKSDSDEKKSSNEDKNKESYDEKNDSSIKE